MNKGYEETSIGSIFPCSMEVTENYGKKHSGNYEKHKWWYKFVELIAPPPKRT